MQKASTICQTHQTPIKFLCISPKCNSTLPYCCSQDSCQKKHDHPTRQLISISRLSDLITSSYYSLDHLLPRIRDYFKRAREQLLETLQKDEDILVYLIKRMEYCESEHIWQTLREVMSGEYYRVTARRTLALVEDLQREERRERVRATAKYYEEEIAKGKARVQAVLGSQQYADLVLAKRFANPRKHIEFQSKIVQGKQAEKLSNLLRKGGLGLVSLGLAYRASQNDYDSYSYHSKVNGLLPTITLVKTSSNRIFGCYLNCKILHTEDWIADPSRKSFIFSLDNNTIHKLKDDDGKLKAVFGGSKGPQIGFGCDFYIGDQCHVNLTSGSRLGGSYELPQNMVFRTVEADCYLAGSREFIVEEYEVFRVL